MNEYRKTSGWYYYPEDKSNWEYHILDKMFCCDKLKEEWEESVTFSGFNCYDEDHYPRVVIKSGYGDGDSGWDNIKINYCPFCGEKIELLQKVKVVVKRKIKKVKIPEKIEEEEIEKEIIIDG